MGLGSDGVLRNRSLAHTVLHERLIMIAAASPPIAAALIAAAVDKGDSYSRGDAGVAVVSAGLGLALQKLFRKRTFRMAKNEKGESKKWRLRVLDLTVSKSKNDY